MKRLVIIFAAACMMLAACSSTGGSQSADTKESSMERHPFEKLSVGELKDIVLFVIPPDKETHLSEEQMEKCVELLREIEVVKKVASEKLVGQMIECRIEKKDGSVCKVQLLNPYVVIDGAWFEMKEDPQDRFSEFANGIIHY